MRELLAALSSHGRVFAPTQKGSEVGLVSVPEGGRVRLAPGLPALPPEEHILPPADAFFGVRRKPPDMTARTRHVVLFALPPCLVYSIRFLDRLLGTGPFRDGHYAAKRSCTLIVAINCTTQRRGCYCGKLGIGPTLRSSRDADIVLTPAGSGFVLESGSPTGTKILSSLRLGAARAA